jgi:type I restriction enzyme S subunit
VWHTVDKDYNGWRKERIEQAPRQQALYPFLSESAVVRLFAQDRTNRSSASTMPDPPTPPTMRRYTDYKDSGVEWLGEVPDHWTVYRLKDVGKSIIGVTYSPDNLAEDESQGILVLRSSNIQNGRLSLDDNVFIRQEVPRRQILQCGDILLCSRNGSRALIGKNILIDERTEGNTFGAFMTIYRTRMFKFIYYFFNSMLFESQSGAFGSSTINQLTSATLNNLFVVLPPAAEQQAIADYLDAKTAQIDRKIDLLTQKAAKYRQLKRSIINAAVTRGLDESVPMKDSGVEWIDKVPVHWQICHLKRAVKPKITDGPHESPVYYDQGVPFVSAEAIQNGEVNFDSIRGYISPEQDLIYSRKCKPKRNDVFIVKSGSTTGKIGYVSTDVNFQIWSPLALVRPNGEHSPRYVFHFLSSECFQAQIRGSWSLGTQPNIGMGVLENLQIVAPPLDEQIAIAEFIDERGDQIDRIIGGVSAQIDKLNDLRKSLINDVVTGKLRVT